MQTIDGIVRPFEEGPHAVLEHSVDVVIEAASEELVLAPEAPVDRRRT